MRFYGQFQPQVDRVIREEYFPDKQDGVAIDVGATDGVFINNTLHFEQAGWKVLCVEANPRYKEALEKSRSCAANYAVDCYNADDVVFHEVLVPSMKNYSSVSALEIDPKLLESHQKAYGCTVSEVHTNVRTLDWLIEHYGFDKNPIDFVSIDVEGTEPNVLRGFSIGKWNPRLLVVENNFSEGTDECMEILKPHGYYLDRRLEVNDFFVKKI